MATTLVPNRYHVLVEDIRRLINGGKDQAQTALNRIAVETYHKIGARIKKENLEQTAGYGESVMESMAKELKTDRSTLVRCVQLYEFYPKGVPKNQVSWSHWRVLLALPTEKERLYYLREAEKKGWTRDDLAKAVQEDRISTLDPASEVKKPIKLARPKGGPYIYKATVNRVLDGDTFTADLMLGFMVRVEQTLRLAGIDAPELKEDGGPEALEYLRGQLAKAKTVVIRTRKDDRFGRYVAHVFYSLEEDADKEKVFLTGKWLNVEMLERGLARLY